jgi:hypothetical protein
VALLHQASGAAIAAADMLYVWKLPSTAGDKVCMRNFNWNALVQQPSAKLPACSRLQL